MYRLTVGIVSYNRPVELLRTIKSLLPLPHNVEVVICDDKSPKQDAIRQIIKDVVINEQFRFIANEKNLGYDRNLFQVIEAANSSHVLLLGDDDYLDSGALQNIFDFIQATNDFKCGFVCFYDPIQKKYSRNYYSSKYFQPEFITANGSFIYNSILFSGLIFCKESVIRDINMYKKYFTSIYIQVAIFALIHIKYGTYFIKGPGIIVGGDGESGFGFNEAAYNHDDLKDRSSVITNLSYHKRLFQVVKKIENDIERDIFTPFVKEYKLRSVKAFFLARQSGKKSAFQYYLGLKNLNIPGFNLLFPVYLIIFFMPVIVMRIPLNIFQRIIQKQRKFNISN